MRLYGNGTLLNGMTERVTLEKSRGDAAATLTATLLTAVGDTYFQKESLAVGDAVRLLDDKGAERFLGAVQMLRRDGERVQLIACDRGLYLTQNQLHGVFAGSGREIVAAVARQLGLTVGEVETENTYRCLTAKTGESAFSLLRRAVGESAEIGLADGFLTVKKPSGIVYRPSQEQVLSVYGTADLRRTVNRCLVVDRRGRVVGSAQNEGEMTAYGQRQRVMAKQGSDPNGQARAALQSKAMTASLTLWGDWNCACGSALELHRPDWGVDGVYRITGVKHRWAGGIFTTEVGLEGTE